MDIYKDSFMVIAENTSEGHTIYADKLQGYFPMSVPVGRYVAKKLKENERHGYKVLDCAKKISRKRGRIL
jgi:hypothetical protein